jgi:hypothetical protein
MPRNRPEFESGLAVTDLSLGTVGRLATRAGTVLVLLAAPLALATFLAVLAGAPNPVAGLDTALAATSGPLGAAGGVEWLLHLGVLGLLAGSWILGAGLVLTGLTD